MALAACISDRATFLVHAFPQFPCLPVGNIQYGISGHSMTYNFLLIQNRRIATDVANIGKGFYNTNANGCYLNVKLLRPVSVSVGFFLS